MRSGPLRLVAIGVDWAVLPLAVVGVAIVVVGVTLIKREGQHRGRQALGWILILIGALISAVRFR